MRKCLELLPQEKKLDIKTKLADALLAQMAEEGIEPVRQMVQQRAYDSGNCDLMTRLVAVSTILGMTFPEYPIWKREAEEKWARMERRMKEIRGFFQPPPTPPVAPKPGPARKPDADLERKPAPLLRTEKQVGRNDPCPCGSGKKFKKCCLNK